MGDPLPGIYSTGPLALVEFNDATTHEYFWLTLWWYITRVQHDSTSGLKSCGCHDPVYKYEQQLKPVMVLTVIVESSLFGLIFFFLFSPNKVWATIYCKY